MYCKIRDFGSSSVHTDGKVIGQPSSFCWTEEWVWRGNERRSADLEVSKRHDAPEIMEMEIRGMDAE
jgi:hypothetical protein